MVELKTKLTGKGILYIPKEIREAFGPNLRIIPNSLAALFFPDGADYEDVLRSVEIIEADLKHRIELQRRAKHSQTLNNSGSEARQ
jgi:hypothetical protein